LHLWLSGSSLVLGLGLIATSSGEFGLEVVLDLLLAGLLLFLECGKVVLASIFLTVLLLLG
jgi:hypothetical protein